MASIVLVYNPYECTWEAEANYSNGLVVIAEYCESKEISIINLIEVLKDK